MNAFYAREFSEHPNALSRAEVCGFVHRLLLEEAIEADEEMLRPVVSLQAVAKELADVVYVAYNAAWAFNIDLDRALVEVHRANMSKLEANVRREDGKLLKHEGYVDPDLSGCVGA